ncbi:MAG: class I SAM-dependent methyltransferase [bacterium]
MAGKDIFDRNARRYDNWFESEKGKLIFPAELKCIEKILPPEYRDWVEAGVGSGRFAGALGLKYGFDPSLSMLKIAKDRGIKVHKSRAEKLPCRQNSVPGILLVVTLCFLDAPGEAFREFARVLKPGGYLLAGFIPANSSWGEFYREKKKAGHPFYSSAKFYTAKQTIKLANQRGLDLIRAASTLAGKPEENSGETTICPEVREDYGFTALLFRKN